MTASLRRLAGRLASGSPVPVFAAVGVDGRDRVEALRLRDEVRLVDTPRHARVLLVAGTVPTGLEACLDRVHDQIPHPRATLTWDAGGNDPVPALMALDRELLGAEGRSEEHRLPDEPPAPWRGRGDHGQGGEGMMGGKPYGRPMAMTGGDVRDGLALDRLEVTVGPFFPAFPPGLTLALVLQGDVVQEVEVVHPAFAQALPGVVARIREEAVPAGALHEARARLLFRRLFRVLRVAGAPAPARRALALSLAPGVGPGDARRLAALLRRGGTLWALPDAGDRPEWCDVRRRTVRWMEAAEETLTKLRDADLSEERIGPFADLASLGPPFSGDLGPDEVDARLRRELPGMEWGEMARVIAALDPVRGLP